LPDAISNIWSEKFVIDKLCIDHRHKHCGAAHVHMPGLDETHFEGHE